jgi:hypothetical protein
MSLVSQISALATRIATEIKAVRDEIAGIGGGAPDPHAATHAAGGSDAVTLAQSQVTNLTSDLAAKANLSGATFTGTVFQNAGAETRAINRPNIASRVESGFYEHDTTTTAEGWPLNASWYHLISSTHSNTANYFAMQFASDFFDSNQLFYRSTNNNGTGTWYRVYHANNIHSTIVSPTPAGSAGVRKTTISTSNPSGGADGDVWLKYTP